MKFIFGLVLWFIGLILISIILSLILVPFGFNFTQCYKFIFIIGGILDIFIIIIKSIIKKFKRG